MHALVVHKNRARYDVYVGRPTQWGNPYVIGADGTRNQVIAKYRGWLLRNPQLLAQLPTLRGKTLACWCAPEACHADVLAELANSGDDYRCFCDGSGYYDEPDGCAKCTSAS